MFDSKKEEKEECSHTMKIETYPQPLKMYREVIDDCLFDTITPQGITECNFFDIPIGESLTGKRKGPDETNLFEHRIIPFSQRFMIQSIFAEIRPFYARISKNHGVKNLCRLLDGHIQLFINNKAYQRLPLTLITSYSLFLSEDAPDRCTYCGAPITQLGRCEYCGSSVNGEALSFPLGREVVAVDRKRRFGNAYCLTHGTPFWIEAHWKEPMTETNNLSLRVYLSGQKERTVQ